MNFQQHRIDRSTVLLTPTAFVKSPSKIEGSHIAQEKSKKSIILNCEKKLFNNLDIGSMRFFLKKPKIQLKNKEVDNDIKPSLTPVIEGVPKEPKTFKACKFISSLDSSISENRSKTTPGPRLSMSPSSRPAVSSGDSPLLGIRKLSRKSSNHDFACPQSRASLRGCPAISKERKQRLADEMKRPAVKLVNSVRSRLPETNESLHNSFIRFKCRESANNLAVGSPASKRYA